MTEHRGHVVQLYRLDEALSKADLLAHMEFDHSQVPPFSKRITKADLLALHRLVHFGIGR